MPGPQPLRKSLGADRRLRRRAIGRRRVAPARLSVGFVVSRYGSWREVYLADPTWGRNVYGRPHDWGRNVDGDHSPTSSETSAIRCSSAAYRARLPLRGSVAARSHWDTDPMEHPTASAMLCRLILARCRIMRRSMGSGSGVASLVRVTGMSLVWCRAYQLSTL